MKGVKLFGLLNLSIPLLLGTVGRNYYTKYFKLKKRSEQVVVPEQVVVSWTELDTNLLGEILSRLCATDQTRFTLVCKNWCAAAHPTVLNNSAALPWHGWIVPGSSRIKISDPLSSSANHLASLQTIPWSKFGIPSPSRPPFASNVYFFTVENNWLFICIEKSTYFIWTSAYFVLFHPFTKTILTLPKFTYPLFKYFYFTATFSTHPDSPDCVFCMIDTQSSEEIHVITYRNGDKEWTARKFNMVRDYMPGFCLPYIIGGIVYFANKFGQVASYSILDAEFNFDYLLIDERFLHNAYNNYRRMKSFVLNGELMILYYNYFLERGATVPGAQFVRRYDRSAKVWVPVSTLADYALFFSENIYAVSLINTKDRRYKGVLPNKLYHFYNGRCLLYSLQDGDLVQLKNCGSELPEYNDIYYFPSSHWLEAPCVRSSFSDNQGSL